MIKNINNDLESFEISLEYVLVTHTNDKDLFVKNKNEQLICNLYH